MIDVTELEAIARIRSSQLGDHVIQLGHFVSTRQWDKAAQACQDHNMTLNQLAGAIGQLLALVPSGDAPPLPVDVPKKKTRA